jgi:hypothetical protein
MHAFDPLAWHDFFVGSMGASAALTGLLFVAISINLQQILKLPALPGRAAVSLGILVAALIVACFGLTPGLSPVTFGIEVAAVGTLVTTQAVWVNVGKHDPADRVSWRVERFVTVVLPGLAFLGGGCSLIAGGGGGLYWVLAATVAAFVVAALNGWVLLVEVLR